MSYATTGGVIEGGALNDAQITQQMMDDYNEAIDAVINSHYASAQDIFLQAHYDSMGNLNTSVDQLVDATIVLSSVFFVADLAASADTTQEQMALQSVLANDPSLQITQMEVDAFNQSLDAVGAYAREAGAFLAAANNESLTAAVDSFAENNNVAVGAYTAVTFSQSIDQYIITWGDHGFAAGWSGYNTGNIYDVNDIYNLGAYLSSGGS
jgi:hypothetical protein